MHIAVTVTRSGTALQEGSAAGGIYIGNRSISTFATSSMRRRYDFTWFPNYGAWVLDTVAMVYMSSEYTSSGTQKSTALPNDVFLPEFDVP